MYATAEQFILRVGKFQTIQLTDRDGMGEIDMEVLNVTLSDASSQIDGYLITRYALPLADIPQNLTRICCDIARYRLASMSSVGITDEIIKRYQLSLDELEKFSKGAISLGMKRVDESDVSDSDGCDAVVFSNSLNRVFHRDN